MKRTQRIVFLAAMLLAVSGYTECYKPVGRGDGLPKHIKTLAIPPFQNPSLRFKVEQRFTAAMVDEALRRARSINVVSTTEGADAVMLGTIKNFAFRPVLLGRSPSSVGRRVNGTRSAAARRWCHLHGGSRADDSCGQNVRMSTDVRSKCRHVGACQCSVVGPRERVGLRA